MTSQNLSVDKKRLKYLLLEGIHPSAKNLFQRDGYENVVVKNKSLEGQELLDQMADVHFLGIRSRTQITESLLDAAPKLAAIGCFCIGTNQVDLDAAEARGIPVFNAPFANTRSVAELVLAEMVLLLRRIPEKSAAAHRGQWLKSASGAFETRGKVLGIVGYGHIGTQLGVLAEGLGMQVLYYDIENKLALGNAKSVASLDDLLEQVDVVSFHVPATELTNNMLNTSNLSKLRAGAIVINASRGQVVDIDALASSLAEGHIGGAALDVFPLEPTSNTEEFCSPLRNLPNVILTPHIGGSTQEAQANIGVEVAEKLIRYSNNGSTLSAVNFPEVSLPEHQTSHRILHIHKNEPGVLFLINQCFSHGNINIAAQYLQTRGSIGYVVTDVDQQYSDQTLQALKQIKGTIKTRILY